MIEELNRSWNGEPWYGPSLRPLLDGITEQQARAHKLADAHTILELVAHVAFWMDMTAKRLDGFTGKAPTEQEWGDAKTMTWASALKELDRAYAALLDRVARMDDDAMGRMVQRKFTGFAMLNGLIQHNVYHAGQISLLKKA